VKPGLPVGLLAERGPDLVVGLLGILESGGAYLPLDPEYPAERLAFLLEDCGAPVVVTGAVPEAVAAPLVEGRRRIPLGGLSGRDGDLGPTVPPAELAYVIYTSGSTGRPKGVEIPHGALANFLAAMAERPGLGPGDVLLALTSPSFDIAALELFLPLLVGARVEIAEQPGDGAALLRRLAQSRATVVQATPSGWRLLLAAGFTGGPLRALCGGEALPPDLATSLADGCSALWNLYGPTETTVWSTVERIEATAPISAGRPILHTAVHQLDPRFFPVPLGARGELWIGGRGLARGYRRRPALTAQRFVPDPFSGARGARLYRTGDLARRRADGRLEILGRVDQQVKLRGHRIELGEIEAVLAAHPALAQAAVVLRSDGGEPRLVAYGVPAGGEEPPAPEALRSYLGERLPAAMVPAVFVALEALPATPNGKVDRRALPAPRPVRREAAVAPRSAEEKDLAQIWCDLLEIEAVGVRDNFFDLGGHSLLLARVQAEINRRLGVELSIIDLFQYPTIETLARHLLGHGEPVTEPDPQRAHSRRLARRDRRQARLARRGTHRGPSK
jgi:amino acid adenylation domain-containing protein